MDGSMTPAMPWGTLLLFVCFNTSSFFGGEDVAKLSQHTQSNIIKSFSIYIYIYISIIKRNDSSIIFLQYFYNKS